LQLRFWLAREEVGLGAFLDDAFSTLLFNNHEPSSTGPTSTTTNT
jgi:hypothetical protein